MEKSIRIKSGYIGRKRKRSKSIEKKKSFQGRGIKRSFPKQITAKKQKGRKKKAKKGRKKSHSKLPKTKQKIKKSYKKSCKNQLLQPQIIDNFIVDSLSAVKLICSQCGKNLVYSMKVILDADPGAFEFKNKYFGQAVLCLPCLILYMSTSKSNLKSSLPESDNYSGSLNKKITFKIVPNLDNKQLFTINWSIQDEFRLIGAVEKLGLENWEEIAKSVGKGKIECQSHYFFFYYKSKESNTPSDFNFGLNNKLILKKNKESEDLLKKKYSSNLGYIPFTTTNHLNQSRSLVQGRRNKKEDSQENNQQPANPNNIKNMQTAWENLGYWQKRKEFDVEHKNDAELELSELEFRSDDDAETRELNIRMLKNYNNILII